MGRGEGSTGATIKETRTKSRRRGEVGEGGGIGWGGVEGWGVNADNCNLIAIKKILIKKIKCKGHSSTNVPC